MEENGDLFVIALLCVYFFLDSVLSYSEWMICGVEGKKKDQGFSLMGFLKLLHTSGLPPEDQLIALAS